MLQASIVPLVLRLSLLEGYVHTLHVYTLYTYTPYMRTFCMYTLILFSISRQTHAIVLHMSLPPPFKLNVMYMHVCYTGLPIKLSSLGKRHCCKGRHWRCIR